VRTTVFLMKFWSTLYVPQTAVNEFIADGSQAYLVTWALLKHIPDSQNSLCQYIHIDQLTCWRCLILSRTMMLFPVKCPMPAEAWGCLFWVHDSLRWAIAGSPSPDLQSARVRPELLQIAICN
jgi:hypothetical protein